MDMMLSELAKAANKPSEGKTILVYGNAKTGKSSLAATIAESPNIDRVDWFDNENGSEGLISMVKQGALSAEAAAKIRIFRLRDSVEQPVAFETLSKLIGLKRPLNICNVHGRDIEKCGECKAAKGPYQTFDMSKHNARTAIVIDSGSQYSDSILHYYNDGKMAKGTAGLDCYREQGLRLVEFLTELQKGKTNWIMITHALAVELESGSERIASMEYKGPKTERVYPLIGTKPFSMKVGKYFAHVVFLELSLRQHKGGSSTTYKADVITGSRTGWKIEDQKGRFSLVPLFES